MNTSLFVIPEKIFASRQQTAFNLVWEKPVKIPRSEASYDTNDTPGIMDTNRLVGLPTP